MAARLGERHPALRLEVFAQIDYLDLTRGEADLAIRAKAPNESKLTPLAEGSNSIHGLASPDYIARLQSRREVSLREEEGETSDSLAPPTFAEIDWITWAPPYEQVPPRPMLERAIPDFTPAFTSDNFLVLSRAVLEGIGAMIFDRPNAFSRIEDDLVEIDLGFSLPPQDFYLVCAKSMRFVPRVREVAEEMIRLVEDSDEGTINKNTLSHT